jgi:hypothetical protein
LAFDGWRRSRYGRWQRIATERRFVGCDGWHARGTDPHGMLIIDD